jgi:hypothetical protein
VPLQVFFFEFGHAPFAEIRKRLLLFHGHFRKIPLVKRGINVLAHHSILRQVYFKFHVLRRRYIFRHSPLAPGSRFAKVL